MGINRAELSETWQIRFAYFDTYGPVSSTPEGRRAYRALPFFEKMRLGGNIWAFLFGPLYFVIKGMWRKGCTLLAVAVMLAFPILLFDLGSAIERITSILVPVVAMITANYAYYLYVVQGDRSWNPLEGLRKRA
jgi:hypothetical protein